MAFYRRRRLERPMSRAEERALDRRIAEDNRRYRERQAAEDAAFRAWVLAQRAKFTPEQLAEADAAYEARAAQDRIDRLERERRDEQRKLERWRSN